MTIDIETLKQMVCEIITMHVDEASCAESFERLEVYAETSLYGGHASGTMPRVHDHLTRCGECREEYVALLIALQAGNVRSQIACQGLVDDENKDPFAQPRGRSARPQSP